MSKHASGMHEYYTYSKGHYLCCSYILSLPKGLEPVRESTSSQSSVGGGSKSVPLQRKEPQRDHGQSSVLSFSPNPGAPPK